MPQAQVYLSLACDSGGDRLAGVHTLANMLPNFCSASASFCFLVSSGMLGMPLVLPDNLPNMVQPHSAAAAAAAAATPAPFSNSFETLVFVDMLLWNGSLSLLFGGCEVMTTAL
jgi:hypothetical protein